MRENAPHSNSGALVIELFCVAVTLGAWLSFAVTVWLSQLPFNLEMILSSFSLIGVGGWLLSKRYFKLNAITAP